MHIIIQNVLNSPDYQINYFSKFHPMVCCDWVGAMAILLIDCLSLDGLKLSPAYVIDGVALQNKTWGFFYWKYSFLGLVGGSNILSLVNKAEKEITM